MQEALQVIELFGVRFKIEVSFKQAIHTVGAYAYHFWMQDMDPIRRGDGDALLDHFTRTRAIRRGIVSIGQDAASPDFGRPHGPLPKTEERPEDKAAGEPSA